jgi:hypothetical protein
MSPPPGDMAVAVEFATADFPQGLAADLILGGDCRLLLLDKCLKLSLHGFGTFEIENNDLLINAQ